MPVNERKTTRQWQSRVNDNVNYVDDQVDDDDDVHDCSKYLFYKCHQSPTISWSRQVRGAVQISLDDIFK